MQRRIREAKLRGEANGQKVLTRQQNAKFGWLGRKKLRPSITPRTVNYELCVLSTFFRWAIAKNFLFVDPTTIIERFRISRKALPKFLTSDQLTKLFQTCDPDEYRLFMAILLTGMRKGEVEHLTWGDVNFELGIIFIQEKPEWNWKPKTDERIIPISSALRGVLLEQYARRRNDSLVFPNNGGNVDRHILLKFQNICRRAGLKPATVHSLRHSFGAHLRMAGVSLADIADLLGHKDLATTQIYAKVHQEHLRTVISKLGLPGAVGEPSLRHLLPDSTPSIQRDSED